MKFSLLMLVLCSPLTWAQGAPDMASAPHYLQLLANDQVRVFALTLKPLERTMARHDRNFLVVALLDSDVVIWPEGESDIVDYHFNQGDVRFYSGGRALGIRNDRTTEYRNLTVEFLDPKVTNYGYQAYSGGWDYGPASINPPVDPHARFMNSISLGPVTVSDVQLLSRDPLPPPEKPGAELLLPVTDIDLKAGEYERIRKSSGEVVWIAAGRKPTFLNATADAERFIVVLFKTQSKD
ncbi:MAG: hypothetical protein WBQ64_09410 [Terriglobales bacterium]|jgi:hypothetical protein